MRNNRPEDRYIQVGDVKTRSWMQGSGGSWTLLLHGLGGYVENWESNIEKLASGRRVCAVDMVGFGRSDKPVAAYSIAYLARFVNDFMEAVGIPKAAVIGESLGGGVALRLALDHPDRVEKLVLADSVGFGREVSLYLRVPTLPIVGEIFTRPSRKGSAEMLRQCVANQDLVTDDWIELDYELSMLPGAQASLLRALRASANIWGCRSETYRPFLGNGSALKAPILLIWGAQDQILPVAQGKRALQALPNARLEIFDPCGHVPNIDCAEAFNRVVGEFLQAG